MQTDTVKTSAVLSGHQRCSPPTPGPSQAAGAKMIISFLILVLRRSAGTQWCLSFPPAPALNGNLQSPHNQEQFRYMYFVVSKTTLCDCGCGGYHTVDKLHEVFAWSMQHLKTGRAPTRRHDGSMFSPQDRRSRITGLLSCIGALLQARGDWEWLVTAFRLRHFNSDQFCYLCDATQAGFMSYLNMAADAPFRATCITHERYLLDCARQMLSPSALFGAPGFKYEFFATDSMHCGDLGIFPDAIGGLMWVELSHKGLHRSYAEGLTWMNDQLDSYASANNLQRLVVTLPMVKPTDGGHPTLKTKAAMCRHLSGFALFLANRHKLMNLQLDEVRLVPFSAEYHGLAVELATRLVGYHDSCSQEPFSADRCKFEMLGFITAYDGLRRLFRRGLDPALHHAEVFGPRPKLHLCEHLVCDKVPLFGSPRLFWCYADEDFVGLIKRIAMQTKNPRTMEKVLLTKYRLYASLHALALASVS